MFGGVVTLTTSFAYASLSFVERWVNGEFTKEEGGEEQRRTLIWRIATKRRAKLKDYAILAALSAAGMNLTNFSLSYINYTTRIVAKCSKVIPTMVIGTMMQGRRYEKKEYFAAFVLIVGVCMFALGDAASLPEFQSKGIAMLVAALFVEATAGNFEERRMFNVAKPASHAEVLFHANLIGLAMTACGMALEGNLCSILRFMWTRQEFVRSAFFAAIFGYLSISFILLSIRQYGATNTEIIKALRKMLSIALSLLLYPKPLSLNYVLGVMLTVVGILALYLIKKKRFVRAFGNVEAFK